MHKDSDSTSLNWSPQTKYQTSIPGDSDICDSGYTVTLDHNLRDQNKHTPT